MSSIIYFGAVYFGPVYFGLVDPGRVDRSMCFAASIDRIRASR